MILQKFAKAIIRYSFDSAVYIIERFSNMKPYQDQLEDLRTYEDGTLGNAIAKCLDQRGYDLVPKFESHDLKHVLLDYRMDPIGEIRLQAFMIGNGNHTVPSFAILAFGLLLLPSQWKVFFADYKKGKRTIPISQWSIASHGHQSLQSLQHILSEPVTNPKPLFTMKKITRIGAFSSIIAGVGGMFYCLPYLFSSRMEDLVGAGLPFIGGAILAVGGLIALSNLSRKISIAE